MLVLSVVVKEEVVRFFLCVSCNLSCGLHDPVSGLDMDSKQRVLKIPYLPAPVRKCVWLIVMGRKSTYRKILTNFCIVICKYWSPYNLCDYKFHFVRLFLCCSNFVFYISNKVGFFFLLDNFLWGGGVICCRDSHMSFRQFSRRYFCC